MALLWLSKSLLCTAEAMPTRPATSSNALSYAVRLCRMKFTVMRSRNLAGASSAAPSPSQCHSLYASIVARLTQCSGRVSTETCISRTCCISAARFVSSNAAAGTSNHIRLRVYGETGHMEWLHSKHNELAIASLDGNIRLVGLGQPNLAADAQNASRLMRPGHPEGLQEAVANLYCGLADMMLVRRGHAPSDAARLAPSVSDGVAGLHFVAACLESSKRDGAIVSLRTIPDCL